MPPVLPLSAAPEPSSPATRRRPRGSLPRAAVPVHQPVLPLGHGAVHWATLPPEVRARTLTLWLELLAAHRAHADDRRGPRP